MGISIPYNRKQKGFSTKYNAVDSNLHPQGGTILPGKPLFDTEGLFIQSQEIILPPENRQS